MFHKNIDIYERYSFWYDAPDLPSGMVKFSPEADWHDEPPAEYNEEEHGPWITKGHEGGSDTMGITRAMAFADIHSVRLELSFIGGS